MIPGSERERERRCVRILHGREEVEPFPIRIPQAGSSFTRMTNA